MADLGNTFDSGSYEPNTPFELIPPGNYAMRVVSSEIKQSKSTQGAAYLQFEFEMDENRHPDLSGRKIWDNLNLWNPNEKTVQIAQSNLSAICRAVGKPVIRDSSELHGGLLLVKVAIRPAEGEYDARNVVKGYKPIEGAVQPAAAAPAAAAFYVHDHEFKCSLP
jgi:hypothetical protein